MTRTRMGYFVLLLFALGCGLDERVAARLHRELLRTARGFPHLDASTAWHRSFAHGVVAGGVTSRAAMIEPRQYHHDDGADLVLYDGLPVAMGGSFAAHRAEELARHWDHLAGELEGRFICARIRRGSPEVEVLTDALGVAQLYVWEVDGASVVSNSAGLVQRTVGATQPDPLGVSLFLATDAVGADRTLRRDVRVARGGQRWLWRPGDARWTRRTYWSVARDIGQPVRKMDERIADEVIEGVAEFTAGAARVTGRLNAPITGGKDSRMLAAILMARGIDARYWTKGDVGSRDMAIAREIVQRYGLPHRFANRPTQAEADRDPTRDVATEWDAITREFVLQTDGLASIFLVGNIQGQPSNVTRLEVTLSAMCAESARAMHAHGYLCAHDATVRRIAHYLPYAETQTPRGVVRAEAYAKRTVVVRRGPVKVK